MATLDDLKTVLESIDSSMEEQKVLLTNMISMQQRRDRLSSVDTTVAKPSTGQSIGAVASGIGTGVGAAAAGLGIGGILGLGALAMFEDFDAEAIKENIVTLLSISDEVGGKAELLKEGGAFFLAMSGIGIGLAAFGVGQSLTGLGQWITDDTWAKTVKENVVELLSIADEVGGKDELLKGGGAFFLAMSGIGIGLAAFGVGQSLTGLGQWITDDNWSQEIKNNVITLLSIADEVGGRAELLKDGGALGLALFGIGIGLKKFAIGAGITGIAEVIADWGSGGDWAQSVKDNVTTLLSISDVPGIGWDTAEFAAVMFGIGWGLKKFAIGAGVTGAAELFADWASDEDWAQEVKDNVATLLSISDLPGIGFDTVGFAAVMYGLGWGLKKFAIGAGVAGLSELFADWASGGDWAQEVKDNVMTLLSISQGLSGEGMLAALGEGGTFAGVMAGIAAGLIAFSAGDFVGTLLNVGTQVVSFLTGAESPITQIKQIADDAEKLERGAAALVTISEALETFSKIRFSGTNLNFTELATELGKAVPFLDALANGGPVEGSAGWFGSEINFPKGLLDPSLKLDEMAAAIAKVNFVLGQSTEYPVGTVTPAATPTGGQNATKVAEASYAMVAGRPEVPPVELAPAYAMVAGRPEVPQVAVSEKVVPITITNAKIDITSASILSGMMAEPKTTSPGYAYVAGMPEIAQNKARMDVLESAIKAVAESPEISAKPYAQIMQEERDKANTWLSQAEAIAETNKEQNTNNVNYSPVTDASSKTYVGGTTNTTIITPRSGNDLNYGIPYGVQ